jgi:formyl-CoA transferase/CoA:oxalate CoA-transferase
LLPLDDVTVLDLSRVLAGPYASMLLADFGARVIKVEPPAGDETRAFGPPYHHGDATYYLSANRNKRSIVIDLKKPGGVELVWRLAGKADVVLENFRPGVMARLGLDPAKLLVAYPRLVVASVSAYGQTGLPEYVSRPGYDVVMQGVGGVPSLTGPAGGEPYKVGAPIADLTAALHTATGILVALHARQRTGRGQLVDVSLLDGQLSLLTYHAQAQLAGVPTSRMGNAHASLAPYRAYQAGDGWLNLGCASDKHYRAFAVDVLGRADLVDDSRFSSNDARVARRDELDSILEPIFRQHCVADWLERLDRAGIPAGPILSVGDALNHPQAQAREMVTRVPDPRRGGELALVGVPVKLSETPGSVRMPPPGLGEHSETILHEELGLATDEIDRLLAGGVVLSSRRP